MVAGRTIEPFERTIELMNEHVVAFTKPSGYFGLSFPPRGGHWSSYE
jgi:hypothetical protein